MGIINKYLKHVDKNGTMRWLRVPESIGEKYAMEEMWDPYFVKSKIIKAAGQTVVFGDLDCCDIGDRQDTNILLQIKNPINSQFYLRAGYNSSKPSSPFNLTTIWTFNPSDFIVSNSEEYYTIWILLTIKQTYDIIGTKTLKGYFVDYEPFVDLNTNWTWDKTKKNLLANEGPTNPILFQNITMSTPTKDMPFLIGVTDDSGTYRDNITAYIIKGEL